MSNAKLTYLPLVALLLPSLVMADLTISGLDRELERNVRAFATIAEEPCDAEAWLVRRRFRTLESQVRKAIEPFVQSAGKPKLRSTPANRLFCAKSISGLMDLPHLILLFRNYSGRPR
jgi:hypothetical protein